MQPMNHTRWSGCTISNVATDSAKPMDDPFRPAQAPRGQRLRRAIAVGEISRARDPGAGDSLAPVIGKSLEDLSTPAVLVDLDVLERNIGRMAARAREAGVRLRPHAKTHKCPHIARLQRAAGAWGLSVAKVGEAEVFADAGFDSLFVAFPVVGEDKGRRLLALADRVRIAAGVDSLEGASTLARPFRAADRLSTCSSRWTSVTAASA